MAPWSSTQLISSFLWSRFFLCVCLKSIILTRQAHTCTRTLVIWKGDAMNEAVIDRAPAWFKGYVYSACQPKGQHSSINWGAEENNAARRWDFKIILSDFCVRGDWGDLIFCLFFCFTNSLLLKETQMEMGTTKNTFFFVLPFYTKSRTQSRHN